jgi:hypothetical protein
MRRLLALLTPAAPAPGDPLAAPARMDDARKIARAMAYAVLFGMFLATAWTYREAFYSELGRPKNTFLFLPSDHFQDLYNFFGPLQDHDPLGYKYAVYPPFAYIAMEPFVWAGWSGSVALFVVVTAGGLAWFLRRQLSFLPGVDRVAVILALTFATYPFVFAFDRGNIEVVETLLIVALAWAMQKGNWTVAAVAVGAAGALKGYPVILGAPLLVRGMWKQIALAAAVAAALTLLGTIYYSFDVVHAWHLLRLRLDYYNEFYVVRDFGLPFSCSLFSLVKVLITDVFGGSREDVRAAVPVYEAFTILLLAGMVWSLWKLPLKLWHQVTLLVCAVNLLPTVSADYKLLNLIVPLGLFLREGTGERRRWWYFGLFALLMIPKSYFYIRPEGPTYAVVFNPLLMSALVGLIIAEAVRLRRAGTPDAWDEPIADADLARPQDVSA